MQHNSREEVRASSHVVVDKVLVGLLGSKVFVRIRPKQIAHESMGWRFAETVDLYVKSVSSQSLEEDQANYSHFASHLGFAAPERDLRGCRGTVCS